MKQALSLVPLAGLLLGILSTLGGAFFYWNGAVRKRYAAERDFEHLRRNQEQILQMLKLLDDDLGDVKTELVRLGSKADRA